MTHPVPTAAMDDRLGIVGTAGSGKTYTAGTLVERLLARKQRVVIVDPLDVWWGLRLQADGKTPSPYSVVIFGGHFKTRLSELSTFGILTYPDRESVALADWGGA